MADVKTSDETALANPVGDELIRFAKAGANGKMSAKQVALTGWSHGTAFPSTPSPGQKYVDDNTGIEYTYYYDGTSNKWVEF